MAGISRVEKRNRRPGRRTTPAGSLRNTMPATVSTPPASKSCQRVLRMRPLRPIRASSTPVWKNLRIRLLRAGRVSPRAPCLSAGPTDELHTTTFRRCARSLIVAPCTRPRAACRQWYASGLFTRMPQQRLTWPSHPATTPSHASRRRTPDRRQFARPGLLVQRVFPIGPRLPQLTWRGQVLRWFASGLSRCPDGCDCGCAGRSGRGCRRPAPSPDWGGAMPVDEVGRVHGANLEKVDHSGAPLTSEGG